MNVTDDSVRRRHWATLAALAALYLALTGLAVLARDCVTVGTAIPSWRLGDAPVTLPNNMFDRFQFTDASYVLESDVSLSADLRGQALTIALDCYHAPLALTVDGIAIADTGDVRVGVHRYVLTPSQTDRAQLHLALAAHKDLESVGGFGVAPRIALASETRGTVAAFNRYTAIVAAVISGLLAFLYSLLYVLDRRREYVVLVVAMIDSIVLDLYLVGAITRSPDLLIGRLAPAITVAGGAITFATVLHFVHLAFELGPPPRWLNAMWTLTIVLAVASPVFFPLAVAAALLMVLAGPATTIYILVRCLGITGVHRREARVMVAWAAPQLAFGFSEQYWRLFGVHLVGGLHLFTLSIITMVLVQVTVLVLQYVARQRTIEHTADELRRQVVERSKELAEALGQLADRPPSSLVGKTVDGRYRVLAQLGAGGMGTVYEVERASDRARLALKTLRAHIDAKLMARFAREAQFAAELRHPNLVPVIDVGIADGTLYLVMELVADSLEKERARFGDRKWATPIVAQIASGLAAIHSRGIVHRDLKPANILLDRGVARIADFGLASLHVGALDETTPQSPMLTRAGDVFGTPGYMAPELAAGTSNAAPSSDVFAFGVIAHELLTGRSAFAEPPLVARLHGRPIVATPGELDPVLLRCLDLDPAKRPTAEELVTLSRSAVNAS